jgi:hypothetical protein
MLTSTRGLFATCVTTAGKPKCANIDFELSRETVYPFNFQLFNKLRHSRLRYKSSSIIYRSLLRDEVDKSCPKWRNLKRTILQEYDSGK